MLAGLLLFPGTHSAAPSRASLERQFEQDVKPFVTAYCIGCHGGSKPAAQFDLSPYSNTAAVVRDYRNWNHVLERLTAGQMPPNGMKQPADATRQRVIAWIHAMRDSEARRNDGDPGVVLARRLNVAEYSYTVRDDQLG